MTLGDLIVGTWSWPTLLSEVWPLVLVGLAMFSAGFQRGKRLGTHEQSALKKGRV